MSAPRKTITSTIAVLCLAVASPALAQEAGSYKTTFKKVVDNCEKGLDLSKASLTISKTERTISVSIDSLPTLTGKAGKRGKLRAESKGSSNDMNVRYGFNGRVSDGELQAVFVAEYFTGKKPVCTQSFRVIGSVAKAPKSARGLLPLFATSTWHLQYHGRVNSAL
ncbi:MAG: hypothetical protein GY811_03790 [Myxococcales bacterium]|nr:hypothetical protein [Myxococcales bacterium]